VSALRVSSEGDDPLDNQTEVVCRYRVRFCGTLFALAAIAVACLAATPRAQEANAPLKTVWREDSLVVSPPPKRWDIAVAECAVLHFIPWAWSEYVLDGYWSNISMNSIDINLRHGFEWDPNMFRNNFRSHPYHGSTYFNAARTNGMNFWESVPFAFYSSLTWEIFMESEFPSSGDLITTTVAGAALGEGLYRFSEQLLDDRARGWERFWRELGAVVINPVGGFNRLVRGDMSRKQSVVNHIRNPVIGYVGLGSRTTIEGQSVDKQKIRPAFTWLLRYGDPYRAQPSRRPFDYFTFRGWFSRGNDQNNLTLLQHGVLFGRNLTAGDRDQIAHLAGLFQHYDYVNVELFNYGGVSLAPALVSRWPLARGWNLITQAHAGWLMLGGSNNEYFTNTQGRNYNYTWGFKGKAVLGLASPLFGEVLADYMYFWMESIEGIEGTDRIHQLVVNYNKKIFSGLGVGLEYFLYGRTGDYPGFPQSEVTVDGLRLLIDYAFY